MPQDQGFDSSRSEDSQLSLDLLKERYRQGENVFDLIRKRLNADAETLRDYWEAHLATGANDTLMAELEELYGINSGDLQTRHASDQSALDFWSGFSYVRGHMIPDLQDASKEEPEPQAGNENTALQKFLDSLSVDTRRAMAMELELISKPSVHRLKYTQAQ